MGSIKYFYSLLKIKLSSMLLKKNNTPFGQKVIKQPTSKLVDNDHDFELFV